MSDRPRASVIIPNWNGEAFIVRCVSSALIAARTHRQAAGEEIEVIVVDDASTDGSAEKVRRDCPAARLIPRDLNGGFAEAVNQGAREAEGDLLILLNSDMAVPTDFFTHLLAPMSEPDVFAVTGKTFAWSDGEPNHLNMTARLLRGQVTLEWSDPKERCDTLFLQGGSAVIRRDPFLAMGGFPSLYHPGYWEDYDLSWRAVKAGWRIVYEPRAVARHLGKASLTARHGRDEVARIAERNRLLFTWSSLGGISELWRHAMGLPGWVTREMARGDGATRLRALAAAAKCLPQAVAHRRASPPPRALSDAQVLASTAPSPGVERNVAPGEW